MESKSYLKESKAKLHIPYSNSMNNLIQNLPNLFYKNSNKKQKVKVTFGF